MSKYYDIYLEKEFNGNFHDKVNGNDFFKYEPIDSNYIFEISEKEKNKVKFWEKTLKIFSFIISFFYRNKIQGKMNYKNIKNKSFISLSNHCLYLDNILLRRALKEKKLKILVTEENNIKGFWGKRFRYSGTVPIPSKLKPFFKFKSYLKKILENDTNCIHFYGEKELWPRYRKPRPFLDGVFSLAYDLNKPILPFFFDVKCSMKLSFIKKVTTYIMEPVCPDFLLEKNLSILNMKNKIEKMYIDLYYEINNLKNDVSLYNISKEGYEKLSKHIEFQKRCKVEI